MTPAGTVSSRGAGASKISTDQDIMKRRKYSEMAANSTKHFKKEPAVLTPENGRSPRQAAVELTDRRMAQTLLSKFMLEDIERTCDKTDDDTRASAMM